MPKSALRDADQMMRRAILRDAKKWRKLPTLFRIATGLIVPVKPVNFYYP